jgi:hypothetical protein
MTIDPRALATMWECSVNVGGRGTPMERLGMLAQIAGKQEQIMMSQGLNNPLVGPVEYRNTLARMLETANISDISQYFKQLPPGFQPPAPPPQQDPNVLLAQVQQQKTSADVENDRAKQQTDRAKLLIDDDRERDKASLDAYTRLFTAGAQFGTPVPALPEIQQAMASKAPAIPMLADLPGPTSPQQPATSPQAQQQKPPGSPPSMMGAPTPGGGPQPAQRPPGAPPGGPPPGAPDPATQMAVRQALAGRGMPTAYGQIANRAALAPLMGQGGPRLPPPQGTTPAAPNAG